MAAYLRSRVGAQYHLAFPRGAPSPYAGRTHPRGTNGDPDLPQTAPISASTRKTPQRHTSSGREEEDVSISLTNLLEFLQAYGYPILWLYAFIAAFGVPLPVTLLLLAAGAFSAQGDFNVALLVAIATSASIAGDCAGYLVGRLWGSRVLNLRPRSPFCGGSIGQ